MADLSLPARVLALVGVATIAGGVHSLVVPVHLDRVDNGFEIPGEPTPPVTGESPHPVTENPHNEQGGQTAEPRGAQPGEPGPGASTGQIDLTLASSLHEKSLAGDPVLFLDARLENEYEAGRIMGALHMPHSRLSGGDGLDELAMFASPGEGTLLVIYCTGGDCEASEDTAILLDAAGYTNIAIMADGYEDWADAGLPIEGAGAGAGAGVSP